MKRTFSVYYDSEKFERIFQLFWGNSYESLKSLPISKKMALLLDHLYKRLTMKEYRQDFHFDKEVFSELVKNLNDDPTIERINLYLLNLLKKNGIDEDYLNQYVSDYYSGNIVNGRILAGIEKLAKEWNCSMNEAIKRMIYEARQQE